MINYTEVDDMAAAVRELTDGVGVAVAYDGVGKTTFDASLASLRRRGSGTQVRCSRRWPRALWTSGSGTATRWPRPPGRTGT